MNCPVCGHAFTPALAILAETSTGAQCPKCWMTVRNFPEGFKQARHRSRRSTKRLGRKS